MDIKKGLSLTAFGFAFVLINLNLTLDGATLNVTPDFIGWIMLTIAVDKLGTYTDGKKYLKIVALIMVVLSASLWVLQILKAGYDLSLVQTVSNVVSAVFMFIFFGCLEAVARDFESPRESTIRTLKIPASTMQPSRKRILEQARRLELSVTWESSSSNGSEVPQEMNLINQRDLLLLRIFLILQTKQKILFLLVTKQVRVGSLQARCSNSLRWELAILYVSSLSDACLTTL